MWLHISAIRHNYTDAAARLQRMFRYLGRNSEVWKYVDSDGIAYPVLLEAGQGNYERLTDYWIARLSGVYPALQAGRTPCRLLYHVVCNPKVVADERFFEDFRFATGELLDRELSGLMYLTFYHDDTSWLHTHTLVHPVGVTGDIVSFSIDDIYRLKRSAEEVYYRLRRLSSDGKKSYISVPENNISAEEVMRNALRQRFSRAVLRSPHRTFTRVVKRHS